MDLSQITWQDVQQLPDDGKRREAIDDDWIRDAPDLVVEIATPSTEERDRGVKLRLYWRQGVPEYWIVDPDAEAVEVWGFRGGEPVCRHVTERLPVHVGQETVGEIDLGGVFRPV